MTIEEASKLMTDESYEKLKDVVTCKPVVNMDNKVNNDILMQALCRAITDDVIKPSSLDEKLMKLMNSSTNTLSQSKLAYTLKVVHESQPNIKCVIELLSADMETVIKQWVMDSPYDVKFNKIFEYVLNKFQITPTSVRNKMVDTLKPTIVNNVSQLVSKMLSLETDEQREGIVVSIITIHRLVSMENHILMAKFIDKK